MNNFLNGFTDELTKEASPVFKAVRQRGSALGRKVKGMINRAKKSKKTRAKHGGGEGLDTKYGGGKGNFGGAQAQPFTATDKGGKIGNPKENPENFKKKAGLFDSAKQKADRIGRAAAAAYDKANPNQPPPTRLTRSQPKENPLMVPFPKGTMAQTDKKRVNQPGVTKAVPIGGKQSAKETFTAKLRGADASRRFDAGMARHGGKTTKPGTGSWVHQKTRNP
jgi:hypothetical protein